MFLSYFSVSCRNILFEEKKKKKNHRRQHILFFFHSNRLRCLCLFYFDIPINFSHILNSQKYHRKKKWRIWLLKSVGRKEISWTDTLEYKPKNAFLFRWDWLTSLLLIQNAGSSTSTTDLGKAWKKSGKGGNPFSEENRRRHAEYSAVLAASLHTLRLDQVGTPIVPRLDARALGIIWLV